MVTRVNAGRQEQCGFVARKQRTHSSGLTHSQSRHGSDKILTFWFTIVNPRVYYRALSLTSSTTASPTLRLHTLILGSVSLHAGCHRVSQLSLTLAPFPPAVFAPLSLDADMWHASTPSATTSPGSKSAVRQSTSHEDEPFRLAFPRPFIFRSNPGSADASSVAQPLCVPSAPTSLRPYVSRKFLNSFER